MHKTEAIDEFVVIHNNHTKTANAEVNNKNNKKAGATKVNDIKAIQHAHEAEINSLKEQHEHEIAVMEDSFVCQMEILGEFRVDREAELHKVIEEKDAEIAALKASNAKKTA